MGLSDKIWRWNIRHATVQGTSDMIVDCFRVFLGMWFVAFYPNVEATDPQTMLLKWIGACALLVVMFYVMFPAITRLFFGYYEHYIVEEKEPTEENPAGG